MKKIDLVWLSIFLSISLFFLSGCKSTLEKASLVTPAPTTSDMFISVGGGFNVKDFGTKNAKTTYGFSFEPRHPITEKLVLKTTFENPENKNKPFVTRQEVTIGTQKIHVESPPVSGLELRNYEIIVEAYDPEGKLVGVHHQFIRNHLPSN